MLEFSVRGVRVRVTFAFFAAVGLTASAGGAEQERLLTVLLCSLIHECRHILAMCLFGIRPGRVTFCAGGIALPAEELRCSKGKTCLILSAGPAVNLAASAVSLLLGYKGTFAAAGLALGLFNLLPFRCFDGGRIIAELTGREPSRTLQAAALVPPVCLAVYACLRGSIPLSLIAAAVLILLDF